MDEAARRLAALGVEALSDLELLALVVRPGINGDEAVDRASYLLNKFGSLKALSLARPEELEGHIGYDRRLATAIVAAFQLSRRISFDEPEQLRCAADVATAARPLLDGARQERLVVLVCDAGNRLLRTIKVAEGAVDRAPLPIREILNVVLRHDGRAFAIAHNHPGGTTHPSPSDRRVTDAVKAAAEVVGLRFLGHVVVTECDWQEIA